MPPKPQAPATPAPHKFHPVYNLRGGDFYILADSTMFRVHSHFFIEGSPKFKDELPREDVYPSSNVIGSLSKPYEIQIVTKDELSKFLWVFYNPRYSDYSATVEDWRGILKVACAYNFPKIKRLATTGLEQNKDLSVAERIKIYREFNVGEQYLIPLVIELVTREDYPSDDEVVLLGHPISLLVSRIREHYRSGLDGERTPKSQTSKAQLAEQALLKVPGAKDLILHGLVINQLIMKFASMPYIDDEDSEWVFVNSDSPQACQLMKWGSRQTASSIGQEMSSFEHVPVHGYLVAAASSWTFVIFFGLRAMFPSHSF
ncbi:hypothetical protein CPB83DRAFT_819340 [Crepidotus variabilis]|uniref:BTB domain-containing protein n=1 Tax=Crepidotus variabilis TaxID=179855 RepID=A0A9P6JLA4_9AGAR|nr:hypothetical protein CPB83DRAFT_819340 [Crepidotus variabilis]